MVCVCALQDQFYEYMFAEAVKQDIKVLLENKPKFLLVSTSLQFSSIQKNPVHFSSVLLHTCGMVN